MANGHATLSPSSADRWMICHGAPRMESNAPPEAPSKYADEGTAAHFLAAGCLNHNTDPAEHIGRAIGVLRDGTCVFSEGRIDVPECSVFVIDADMATQVKKYVTGVRFMADEGELLIEQRLSISQITGEEDACGTADAVAIVGKTLKVRDLKYGQGNLVDPVENRQLMLYGLAALDEYSILYDIEEVELSIHQPRVHDEPQIWTVDLVTLEAFREKVKAASSHALNVLHKEVEGAVIHHLHDSPEVCKWCRAKAECPKLTQSVQAAINVEFTDLTVEDNIKQSIRDVSGSPDLAKFYALVPLIESWCDAVNVAMFNRVTAGTEPEYKLVAGKKGARAWQDKAAAEALMKSMRAKHDEMYDYSIISPTVAEKRTKNWTDGAGVEHEATFGQRQWPKLQSLIVQSEGKPTIARASDKRPALEAKFEALSGAEDLV